MTYLSDVSDMIITFVARNNSVSRSELTADC